MTPTGAGAYRRQNLAFVRFAETGAFPDGAASAWDGYAAAMVAEAGVKALAEGRRVPVTMIARPEVYR
jgi:myo-inositol 2-dehydrogenase/D-chiro-inositol 1-dehydrogenase